MNDSSKNRNKDKTAENPQNQLEQLAPTELINSATTGIDQVSTAEVLGLINAQDQQVPQAIQPVIPQIAHVVDRTVQALNNGGHLYYFGAGTSGRLGVLDAAECPPTYGTDPEWVQAFIAGGDRALKQAVEGAEDSPEQGQTDFLKAKAGENDVVIGISASGGAPYVVSALSQARKAGCFTAAITSVGQSSLSQVVHCPLVIETGPEVITGSTRMKAGTAQKLVLNMITTATMIQLGKTYGNLMVDVKPTNAKLVLRAQRLVSILAEVDNLVACQALEQCQYEVKTAIVMLRYQWEPEEARRRLNAHGGKLRATLLDCKQR